MFVVCHLQMFYILTFPISVDNIIAKWVNQIAYEQSHPLQYNFSQAANTNFMIEIVISSAHETMMLT
jgi:hypothetical protein